MLARHLERCAPCNTFAASVAAFTAELRATPLAMREAGGCGRFRTAHPRQNRSRRLPRLSRPRTLRMPFVAVTAAAASMVMTSVVMHQKSVESVTASPPEVRVVYAGAEDDAAMLRGLRDMSYVRQPESDLSTSKRPGILAG